MAHDDTTAAIQNAIDQLKRSPRGVKALRGLMFFILKHDGLDDMNQAAIIGLLEASYGPLAGTTRDMIREALR